MNNVSAKTKLNKASHRAVVAVLFCEESTRIVGVDVTVQRHDVLETGELYNQALTIL